MRVGIGYDIHRFTEGRRLVLGGVLIESEPGLAGHSDADVVLHAIIDALLGAAGKADIGTQFPDSEEQWQDASSSELLQKTVDMIRDDGYEPVNVDVTIIAEKPRIAPYVPDMRASIAQAMGILQDHVSVKATTNEGLDGIGRGEGIVAIAVALLRSPVESRESLLTPCNRRFYTETCLHVGRIFLACDGNVGRSGAMVARAICNR